MNGAKSSGAGSIATTSKMTIDQYGIWSQMLQEGWRHIRDSYYDKNLHGTDWNEVLKRYLPRVDDCGTVYEYSNLYRLMLGELNSSHLGYYTDKNDREAPPDMSADFGVTFDEKFDGVGWKIKKVINDSPADKPGSRLYAGDIIIKINGHEIEPKDNLDSLMLNLADKPTTLLVKNSPDYIVPETKDEKKDSESKNEKDSKSKDEKDSKPDDVKNPNEREVIIKPMPISAMWQLRYQQWVDDNKKTVEEKTKGEIGYIHIQRMYEDSLQKFRRELFSENMNMKALIIDVRFNSGGHTATDVVEMLDRRPAYLTQHRDSQPVTHPILTWHGPIVLLVNAESFSNAEILTHIMHDLGLATIIGEATGGGVISTYDFRLLDGSGFRMPSWLNSRLNGIDMELNGAVPDIIVHIDPTAVADGKDNQLDAAIDYLLKKIK